MFYNDIDFSYLQIKEINILVGFEPTLSRFVDHGVIYNIRAIGCAKQITETPLTFDQSYCFVRLMCMYCFTRRPILITKQPTSQMLIKTHIQNVSINLPHQLSGPVRRHM